MKTIIIFCVLLVCVCTGLLAQQSPTPSGHPLTVLNGSGDGRYLAGEVVSIAGDGAAEGYAFLGWIVLTLNGRVTSWNEQSQFVMPNHASTVAAVYGKVETWFPLGEEKLKAGLLMPKGNRRPQKRTKQLIRVSFSLGDGLSMVKSHDLWWISRVLVDWFPRGEAQGAWGASEISRCFDKGYLGTPIERNQAIPKQSFTEIESGVFEAAVWHESLWTWQQAADKFDEDEEVIPPQLDVRVDLGVSSNQSYFISRMKAAGPLLPIEMKLLWETENKANQIYNPTRKDDPWYYEGFGSTGGSNNGASRNRLFLVPDPEDNKYKATLEVEIPEEFRTKFIAAAYVVDTKVANSDKAFDAEGKCELEFEHLGTSEDIQDFAIRIGYDANDSGTLDPGEITKLAVQNFGEPLIRGTKTSKYDSAKSNIDGIISGTLTSIGTDLLLPHAKRFLQIFRQGDTAGVPSDKLPTSSATVSFDAFNGYLSEWLTHNSGAPFDDEGVANITDYTWGPLTSAADLVATSPQIEEPVRDYYNSSVASLATAHFASLPVGSSAYFPSTGFYSIPHTHESPAWVPVSTLIFDSWLPNQGDDVNGTIGRGRLLSHQARYKVEKQENNIGTTANPFYVVELVVVEVLSQGEVIDLYDFNHMVGGAAQDAAILQIGFGKGAYGTARDRGKIYRNRIEFEKTHTSLP